MTEEELKTLYPLGLKIEMFGSPFIILLILIEWFLIDEILVIPTALAWMISCLIMWVVFMIIGLRKK